MSRRQASLARGQPHLPVEDPTAPGCCRCGRPMALVNDHHLTELPAVDPAVTEIEARRLGEREGA